jgi:hypothetical protein
VKYFIVFLMLSFFVMQGCANQGSNGVTAIDQEQLVATIVNLVEYVQEQREAEEKPDPKPVTPPEQPKPEEPKPEPEKKPEIVTEPNNVPGGSIALKYYKPTNGDRWTYYTYKRQPLLKVGDQVKVTVGTFTKTVKIVKRPNGSIGAEVPGLVIKNSDVGVDRGIAVLIYASYKGPYRPAYITFIKK